MESRHVATMYREAGEESAQAICRYGRWRRLFMFAFCFGIGVTLLGMMLALPPLFSDYCDSAERQYVITRSVYLGTPVFFYGAVLTLAGLVGLRYIKAVSYPPIKPRGAISCGTKLEALGQDQLGRERRQ